MSSEMRVLLFIVTFIGLFYFALFNFAITDESIGAGTSFTQAIQDQMDTITGEVPFASGNPFLDAFAQLGWVFVRIGAFLSLVLTLTGWLNAVTGAYGLFFVVFNLILLTALGYIAVRLLRGGA